MVSSPNIAHFFVTALQQRCSIVTNPDTGESVIIDGGGDFDRLVAWIDRGEGHPDHEIGEYRGCLLYTSPSPRDRTRSRMPSSA